MERLPQRAVSPLSPALSAYLDKWMLWIKSQQKWNSDSQSACLLYGDYRILISKVSAQFCFLQSQEALCDVVWIYVRIYLYRLRGKILILQDKIEFFLSWIFGNRYSTQTNIRLTDWYMRMLGVLIVVICMKHRPEQWGEITYFLMHGSCCWAQFMESSAEQQALLWSFWIDSLSTISLAGRG